MTAEELTPEQRRRFRSLVYDITPWTLDQVAERLEVQLATVRRWRLYGVLPADDADKVGHRPRWHAGTIRLWAMRTWRMELDGTPRKRRMGRGLTPDRELPGG